MATVGYLRPAALRNRISGALAARFNADVTIDRLGLSLTPKLRVSGSGITLRVRDRPDLPPFISIDRFWMDLQPFSTARRHVDTVHVDGLTIRVPPQSAMDTLRKPGDGLKPSNVMIEQLIAHGAELSFVASKPGRRPHVFRIDRLELDRLGFDRAVPFRARLVNPIPLGLVETAGMFGPWMRNDPSATPVRGQYVFSNANLSMIDAISGTLSSTGSFSGRIAAIDVTGTTTTPDFTCSSAADRCRSRPRSPRPSTARTERPSCGASTQGSTIRPSAQRGRWSTCLGRGGTRQT